MPRDASNATSSVLVNLNLVDFFIAKNNITPTNAASIIAAPTKYVQLKNQKEYSTLKF